VAKIFNGAVMCCTYFYWKFLPWV